MLKYNNPFLKSVFIVGVTLGIYFSFMGKFLLAKGGHFMYDSKTKRDPFVSLIGENVHLTDVELLESISEVNVEGVILDPVKGSAAIVNGQILRIGDYMGGFQLSEVTRYQITMLRDGKEYNLVFRNKEEDENVYDGLR